MKSFKNFNGVICFLLCDGMRYDGLVSTPCPAAECERIAGSLSAARRFHVPYAWINGHVISMHRSMGFPPSIDLCIEMVYANAK